MGKRSGRKPATLLNPNDPRWDIQIGLPRQHLILLLVAGKTPFPVRSCKKGGEV